MELVMAVWEQENVVFGIVVDCGRRIWFKRPKVFWMCLFGFE